MERLTYDFCVGNKHCWQVKGADNLECREVCRNQGEKGCTDCPIAKAFDRLAAYEETGLEPEELAQAKKDGQLVFITEKMALAMIAGARAIEKNKRLQGVIYNYDIFGELGAPKEISYFEAAKVLREAAEAALKERECTK